MYRIACSASLWAVAMAACSVATAADEPAAPSPPPSVETIVVTSEKLPVETLIDRKVYSVTSDVQSTFGTLSDILNVIPSVDVDPDGIVSLRGDTNVLILIDGKPSTPFDFVVLWVSKKPDILSLVPKFWSILMEGSCCSL